MLCSSLCGRVKSDGVSLSPCRQVQISSKRKRGHLEKKRRRKVSALCRSRRFLLSHLDVGSCLVQASCTCDSPWCFVPLRVFTFHFHRPWFLLFFALLCWWHQSRKQRGLLLLLMPLHRIEASLISRTLQLPQGQQQNLFTYSASFVPRLYNLLSSHFYLIWLYRPSSSLSRPVRSAGLSPAAAIDIFRCLFDDTSRSEPQGWTLENVRSRTESFFFFFFPMFFFFFFFKKNNKKFFHLPISPAVLLKWSHMNAYVTQYVNGGIRYSEALRETSAGRDVLCIPGSIYFFVSVFFLLPVK